MHMQAWSASRGMLATVKKYLTFTGVLGIVSVTLYVSTKHSEIGFEPNKGKDVCLDGARVNQIETVSAAESKEQLLVERKLLSEFNENAATTKILILAYMRGGSTLFSELFRFNPKNVIWFEPLDAFFVSHYGVQPLGFPSTLQFYHNLTRRILSLEEVEAMTNYLETLLACNKQVDSLPEEVVRHQFFGWSHSFPFAGNCVKELSRSVNSYCLAPIKSVCDTNLSRRHDMSTTDGNRCFQMLRAIESSKLDPSKVRQIADWMSLQSYKSKMTAKRINKTGVSMADGIDIHKLMLFLRHHECTKTLRIKLDTCFNYVRTRCQLAKTITVKVLRSRLEDLQLLIQRSSQLRVIYFVRDPRAVISSRLRFFPPLTFAQNGSYLIEAELLCRKMRLDLAAKKRLDSTHPGTVLLVRYEDLVADTDVTVRNMFSNLGWTFPERVFRSWLNSKTNVTADNGNFQTRRRNWTERISRWRELMSISHVTKMNEVCSDVLHQLGYKH